MISAELRAALTQRSISIRCKIISFIHSVPRCHSIWADEHVVLVQMLLKRHSNAFYTLRPMSSAYGSWNRSPAVATDALNSRRVLAACIETMISHSPHKVAQFLNGVGWYLPS